MALAHRIRRRKSQKKDDVLKLETEIKKLEIDNTAEPEVPQELQKERTPLVEKVAKEIISRQGKKGTPFGAITNSIILQCDKEYGVYEYDVRFKPATCIKR